jgi:hypothetical protein
MILLEHPEPNAVLMRGVDAPYPVRVPESSDELRVPEHRPEYGSTVVDGWTVPNFGVVVYRWDGIERDAQNRRVFR